MPTLRWLGFSRVMSLPPTTILPEVGSSKPATMRSTVVLPQPEGPRNETNSPGSTSRLKSWTTVVVPKDLRTCWMMRKGSAMVSTFSVQFGRFADLRREARQDLDERHAAPGDGEGDDGECCRLIGAVGADVLQVGAEGRPVEQARHGELADDDGEGQERARQHRDQHVRQDDARDDRRPAGAEDLRRLGQGAHVDGAKAGVDGAVHVGQRQRRVADHQQHVGAAIASPGTAAASSSRTCGYSRTR